MEGGMLGSKGYIGEAGIGKRRVHGVGKSVKRKYTCLGSFRAAVVKFPMKTTQEAKGFSRLTVVATVYRNCPLWWGRRGRAT